MLYIGADGSKGQFYTKKNVNKLIYTCIISDKFYVILYPDACALQGNIVEDIAYVVPVHMPSFIHKLCKKKEDQIDKIFEFNNENDRQLAITYFKNIKDKKIKKIEFFTKILKYVVKLD
ncbi:hypothetical protein BDAP_002807 [Binucleata daphniae]